MEQIRFGAYILEELLGRGGMAEVFRATRADDRFAKTVCIKRILPQLSGQPGFVDMLRDEAALAARLQHANLVQAFEFGDVDGTLFIAMELVDGTTLGKVMRALAARGERFPLARALHVAICMCRGLHSAHTASFKGEPLHIVHRDVSPQNVLLGADGAVKISDFGVAHASQRLVRTDDGTIKGKPPYMAPEQLLGLDCDHRVDQFATGVVLWEMLAGAPLFERGGNVLDVVAAVDRCEIPPLARYRDDVWPGLEAVLRRALARDPKARFADMAAFEAALLDEITRLAATPADLDARPLVALAFAATPGTNANGGPTIADLALAPTAIAGGVGAHAARLLTPTVGRPPWIARHGVAAAVLAVGVGVAAGFAIVSRDGPRDPPRVEVLVPTVPEAQDAKQSAEREFMRGDTRAAIAILNDAIARWPGDAELQRMLGIAHARLHESAAAARAYGRYLELAPRAPDRGDVLKVIAEQAGAGDEAKRAERIRAAMACAPCLVKLAGVDVEAHPDAYLACMASEPTCR